MDDIPSGFFMVPDPEYYHMKPNIPYDFETGGLLHSNKFQNILQLTLDGENLIIEQILDGHALSPNLSELKRREIADFCRHVLIINRDKIGWQTVDKYIKELDNKVGSASWDLPVFIFSEEFNQIFSSLLRWELNPELFSLLKQYFIEKHSPYLSDSEIGEKLERNYQFWNIKHLFLLMEGLVEQMNIATNEFSKYQPILDSLTELLMYEIKNKNRDLDRRITLMTLFSRAMVQLNFEFTQEIQDIINRLWIEVEQQYDKQDREAYRYVFAIVFGYIGRTYYQHNIGFVEKRIFLNRILSSFFSFQEIEIGEWLENFINSNVQELVIEYILHGYLNIVNLLNDYALEIPESQTLSETKDLIITTTKSLYEMVEKYLQRIIGTDKIEVDDIFKISRTILNSGEQKRIIEGMIQIITECLKLLIYYDGAEPLIDEKLPIVSKLAAQIRSETAADLYYNHLLMLINQYPYDEYISKIEVEISDTYSIVNSNTFEQIIISQASQIMEEIKDTYQKSNNMKTSILLELFYFISQWLQHFKTKKDLYQDALMICSPILSIILVQLIQAYYKQKKNAMGLIIYLTMQHFVLTIRAEMEVEGSTDLEKTASYLANDFRSIIGDWQIPDLPNINTIAENIKKMQSIDSSDQTASGGMLDDELVMGYFEMVTNLEESVISSNNKINLAELSDFLYEEPKKGIHIFDRIGLNFEEPIPYPLIRNYYKYNAAMSVIPFEVNISEQMFDMDIDSLISYFFATGDDA